MEYIVDLNTHINKLENFQILLEKWGDYKSCIRDIKINQILFMYCLRLEGTAPSLFGWKPNVLLIYYNRPATILFGGDLLYSYQTKFFYFIETHIFINISKRHLKLMQFAVIIPNLWQTR